ncbi:MAG: PLP-dependent aspartate aminotransferase family protein [Actinobacteria bacterium]|nr:PLP-dependent aspartate aminotransferase family protein [Actinomycetota bacterium]
MTDQQRFGSGRGRGKELSTRLVQSGVRFDTVTGAISVPIYQSATFAHPGLGLSTGYDYTRMGNPTRQALEEALADLEGGHSAYAFASGLSALTAVFLMFEAGDHLLLGEDLYGGTYRLLDSVFSRFGLTASYVDTTDPAAVEAAFLPETRAMLLESPSNPMLKITDLATIAQMCRERGVLSIVDNTLMTPYLQRPLELGCDLVVHSATKCLGGHNDLLAGVVVARDERLAEEVAFVQNASGPVLAPHDCWLLLRGLKTLAVRLDRQQENAAALAEWLEAHPLVEAVYYPGMGAMLSFSVVDPALVAQVLGGVQVISFAESLGGVESLVTYPLEQTHADVPEETRRRLGIDERLLRISVGIEDISDLRADLEQALVRS